MYLNKENLESLAQELSIEKTVSINNFLLESLRVKLHKTLVKDVPWGLACKIDGVSNTFQNCNDVADLEESNRFKLENQLDEKFQFIYNTYMIVTSYMEQRHPGHFLYTFLEWLNSYDTLNYFKELTGSQDISKINAQATRYLPGHFLKQHNDENSEEGRLYAYVYSLTKNWNPDWGGLLHILNEQGEITKSLIPKYNTLNVFKVPQNHYVSYVTPYAKEQRLAITGWLLK